MPSAAQAVAVLESLGIIAEETVTEKVIVLLSLDTVPTSQEKELFPQIIAINAALQKAGLLDKWRARKGGSTHERWILLIAEKKR